MARLHEVLNLPDPEQHPNDPRVQRELDRGALAFRRAGGQLSLGDWKEQSARERGALEKAGIRYAAELRGDAEDHRMGWAGEQPEDLEKRETRRQASLEKVWTIMRRSVPKLAIESLREFVHQNGHVKMLDEVRPHGQLSEEDAARRLLEYYKKIQGTVEAMRAQQTTAAGAA